MPKIDPPAVQGFNEYIEIGQAKRVKFIVCINGVGDVDMCASR